MEQGAPPAPSLEDLVASGLPLIVADAMGRVAEINDAFTRVYGWEANQLMGESLGLILPEAHRMSHQLAFSRFQPPQASAILGHPLRLATRCADGSEITSEHFIIAIQRAGGWQFAATLKPLS